MKIIIAFAIAATGSFIFYHAIEWLLVSWMQHPYYKQGFIVLALSIITGIWRGIKNKKPFGDNYVWLPCLLLSSMSYISGIYTGLMFLQALAIFIAVLSIIFLLGAYLPAKALIAPALLPLLAIPFPFIPEITAFLQMAIVRASTLTLQVMNLSVQCSGARIFFPDGEAVVGEPSSGIRSLIALVTIAVFAAVWSGKMTVKGKVVLSIASFFVAIFGNYIRVVTFSIVGYFWNLDTAYDMWHDTGNLFFWILTLLAFMGIWYLCNREHANKKHKEVKR